jgi:hypothetical protein
MIGQRHAPAALCPGERTPGTNCTGGWVGPRAGLNTEVRRKILCPCRGSNPDRPVVLSVVRHYTDWATPVTCKDNYMYYCIPNHTNTTQRNVITHLILFRQLRTTEHISDMSGTENPSVHETKNRTGSGECLGHQLRVPQCCVSVNTAVTGDKL